MQRIKSGNAYEDRDNQKWLLGSFVPQGQILHDETVEVKFDNSAKGDCRPFFAEPEATTTLTILVRGQVRITFLENEQEEVVLLSQEGDYALSRPGTQHKWVVEEENTLTITIRWPSKR